MSSAKPSRLEDQAASAALYVTKGKNDKSNKPKNYPLDADGKLSSASAATSLKHAHPQDLPAFPVVGIPNTESSAGAAASLANANQKPIELWQPSEIPEANTAAHLAKDYRVDAIYQPELGPAGSKAALQAHREGADVKIWRPSGTDAGQSAAGQAMRAKLPPSRVTRGGTADGNHKALLAAVGAVSGNRQRSGSTPVASSLYPDAQNSASNALKAATSANRPSKALQSSAGPNSKQSSLDAAKVHNQAVTNLSRDMYTSHPPVAPELEERNKQDTLRAAAVVMAKQMYDVQQKRSAEDAALRRAEGAHAAGIAGERPLSSASSGTSEPPKYVNLEEAARKLAAERLAKMHDEHAAYRNYYGQSGASNKRISLRGRRRASSDGSAVDSDLERSRQIRNQMSIFSNSVNQVDEKKRKQDRESLLAAAQRNVRASMNAQDQKVFNETGKVSPAMMAEWEAKARAKAEADSQVRLANHGMVSIGGGKFLDQSEVDAIAAAKVQPTLDDITETAEKQRARDEAIRQEQVERQRIAAEKAADAKERDAKTKEQWKKFREEEKQEEKNRKDEAKVKKLDDRKTRDDEKRKTTLGKIKGIFSKDDQDGGNKEALERLEGKTSDSVEDAEPKASSHDQEDHEGIADHDTPTAVTSAPAKATDGSLAKEVVKRIEDTDAEVFTGVVSTLPDHTKEEKPSVDVPSSAEPDSKEKGQAIVAEPQAADTAGEAPHQNLGALSDQSPASTESAPKPPTNPAPLRDRIALPAKAIEPTTETTVTGGTQKPTSPSRDKDSSKVSSWLKSKLGRRSSRAGATGFAEKSGAKPVISAPKDPKVFIGAANLGAPDYQLDRASSDAADSSMRAVALAGRNAGPVDAPAATPDAPSAGPAHSEEKEKHSTHHDADSDSASVSSLSSDEDTRGRSNTRLADHIEQNKLRAAQKHLEKQQQQQAAAAPATTEQQDFAATGKKEAPTSGDRGESSEEFVEAKDHLDLEPPDKSILGRKSGEGKKSDSPVRDSKFVEQL